MATVLQTRPVLAAIMASFVMLPIRWRVAVRGAIAQPKVRAWMHTDAVNRPGFPDKPTRSASVRVARYCR